MLNCFIKKPLYVNNGLRDICTKSTNESVRKLTEKYNLERNKPNLDVLCNDTNNNRPKWNGLFFLLILSISSIPFFFYKRLN